MKKIIITFFAILTTFAQSAFAGVDKGINVREVQTLLAELCYDPGPIDGLWGKKTETAVKDLYGSVKGSYDGQFDLVDLGFLREYPIWYGGNNCSIKATNSKINKASELTKSPKVIDYGHAIPERPGKKPNYETLAYYLQKDINEGYGWLGDVRDLPQVKISGATDYFKFKSDLQINQTIKKQLNTTALISYLYYEDGKIKIDEKSPPDRFGKLFDDETRLIANSISKSVVSYLVGHAICDGYIPSLQHKMDDWDVLTNTLYSEQQVSDVLHMRTGDQKHVGIWDGVKAASGYGKNPHDRSIKSIMTNELKGSRSGSKIFNYNNLNLNIAFNYLIFKTGKDFNKFSAKVFQKHIKTQHMVVFNGKHRDQFTKQSMQVSDGRENGHFFATRYDYLRFAVAMLNDWQSDNCVGKYLKQLMSDSKSKGLGPGSGPFQNFKGYSGFFHTEYTGMSRRNIFGMDGYGGQMIWIDFDNGRIVSTNAIHNNFDWKRIVYRVIREGI